MSRILLLEDDAMIASGILYALETEGYETNHATGIKDAGSLIEHYNFDLAIIDMQLPDGTGFDVSEIFKNNATSVIFLTVVDDENTIVRAFDEGAQDYIVKPFRIRALSSFGVEPLTIAQLGISEASFSASRINLVNIKIPLRGMPDLGFNRRFVHPTISLYMSTRSNSCRRLFSS